MQAPVIDESALLAALRAVNSELRDPRELATLLERSGKPLLLIDETKEADLVMWSCVAVSGKLAWKLNERMDNALQLEPHLRTRTGGALLRETSEAGIAYREIIKDALQGAQVLRAGITFDSLREWRRGTRFRLTTEHTKLRLDKGEFAAVISIVGVVAERMGLQGLVVAIVDAAMQNGLDPNQLGLRSDEHGTVLVDDGIQPRLIWASSPEWRDVGALLDIPDFDAALARAAPEYSDFVARVRGAPLGILTYWPSVGDTEPP